MATAYRLGESEMRGPVRRLGRGQRGGARAQADDPAGGEGAIHVDLEHLDDDLDHTDRRLA